MKTPRVCFRSSFTRLFCFCFVLLQTVACAYGQDTDTGNANLYPQRRMLLRDEGLSQLAFVDLAHPDSNWYVSVPAGRDLQLVGMGRVLIGTGNGYEEREISSGKKLFELTTFQGTVGARRLRNGNTLLTGLNWQGKQGIVLVEVDREGMVKKSVNFPGFDYVRLVRVTPKGTFLVTANEEVFEGDANGKISWKVKLAGMGKTHAWQAVRIGNGQTLVSTGYAKTFQRFDARGRLLDSITGPDAVHPNFYAGFQVLASGHYIVANWQGHGPKYGASGHQVLEYTPAGKLVWSWKQDAARFSSIQGVIVLDGLDMDRLYIEGAGGQLGAIKSPK